MGSPTQTWRTGSSSRILSRMRQDRELTGGVSPWGEAPLWTLLAVWCVITRLITRVTYLEDPDSIRFALAVADQYDVTALQPHFPGYPVFWAIVKPIYVLTGSLSVSFSVVGGLATVLLVAAGLLMLPGNRLRSPEGLAWTVLVIWNPMVWLLGNRYMPDLLGAAVVLATVGFAIRAMRQARTADALIAGTLFGLLGGLRLSYVPFALIPLAGVAWSVPRARAALFGSTVIGTLVWFVPLMAYTGWEPMISAAGRQTVGHFTEFGGTVLSESTASGDRIGRAIAAIWADGLGAWLPGRHLLTAVVAASVSAIGGRVLFVALITQKFESRDRSWLAFALRWLLPCVVLYSIWMVLYQNVLYKSRHVLPLLTVALLVLSIGAVEVARKRIGRGIVASGTLAYALVAVVLAAQHKEPTAIAQVVEQVRVISETEPDLRVVAVPLVTFMLKVQGVDATFVEADDREAMALLNSDREAGFSIVSIGMRLENKVPDTKSTFYHNPFVNRMWPEIPFYVYTSGH